MNRLFILLVLMMPVLPVSAGDIVAADVLLYEETEAGTDAYKVRMLVTDAYLRIDDGIDNGDYILLDRSNKRISSVSVEEHNQLIIDFSPADNSPPDSLVLTETAEIDEDAPAIAGTQPVSRRFLANGEVCFEAVTLAGVMEDAVSALAEYATILASRERTVVDEMPSGLRTPCYLAHFVHAPARYLQHGLPIQETDNRGYSRLLVDYRTEVKLPAGLFELPDGYDVINIGGTQP